MKTLDERQIEEALYVYRRYATEVVEGLKLCPWALPSRKAGRVREQVILLSDANAGEAAKAVHEISSDEGIDIGLLIFPRLALGRMDFERFVKSVRDEDMKNYEVGGPPMAMAAFHPDGQPDLATAERLTPFLRCTPDPTIQLVRTSALEKVRSADEHGSKLVDINTIDWNTYLKTPAKVPLHERIADMNLETVTNLGVTEVQALLRDIRADRDRRYLALQQP
ncbi:MAG: DUF1415 family protein [Sandaracinaceae bacterium]|nr:DUF1415 family protein [Sandaracinaceae bacterium]